MNPTTDPALRSWVPVPADSHFPIQNLPYGVFYRHRDGLRVRRGRVFAPARAGGETQDRDEHRPHGSDFMPAPGIHAGGSRH